jgi:hypothetical protein
LVQAFVENKPKFIQEAFEADVNLTPFLTSYLEVKKDEAKKEVAPDWLKQPKAKKLKMLANLSTKVAKRTFQERTATNSGPKRTR